MSAIDLAAKFGSWFGPIWGSIRVPSTQAPAIRISGRAMLTATHSVHVIELGAKRVVVGCHPTGFVVLEGGPNPDGCSGGETSL